MTPKLKEEVRQLIDELIETLESVDSVRDVAIRMVEYKYDSMMALIEQLSEFLQGNDFDIYSVYFFEKQYMIEEIKRITI